MKSLPGQQSFLSEITDAIFSPCRTYRYVLTRIWDPGKPSCNFIMLNPSTADEFNNDPTIRRCMGYAKQWGDGGIIITNLFAIRATDPKDMRKHGDSVGPDNNFHIFSCALRSNRVIAAWGNHGRHRSRDLYVVDLLKRHSIELFCLAVTKDGNPGHPLYLKSDFKPIPWDHQACSR